MKPEYLRIGNYVSHYGAVHLVKSIGQGNCKLQLLNTKTASENCSINSIRGIPLTEDWLLKFGFEEYEMKTSKRFTLNYNFLRVTITKKNKITKVVILNNHIPKIKHVHQLQNLYHALTGKEL